MRLPKKNVLCNEILLIVSVWLVFFYLELCTPFERVIQPEEMWKYKYPRSGQYVPTSMLWVLAMVFPIVFLSIDYTHTANKLLYTRSLCCLFLLLGLNGLCTICIKLMVGRPRPDYYWRCYPDGATSADAVCTGDARAITEGRKSFPSGHASFSFAAMSFVVFYLNDRLHVFQNRNEPWRLIACIAPALLAAAVAISRTCDYHHHYEDVICGGLLGTSLAYVCYHQYFPLIVTPVSQHQHEHPSNHCSENEN